MAQPGDRLLITMTSETWSATFEARVVRVDPLDAFGREVAVEFEDLDSNAVEFLWEHTKSPQQA